MSVANQLARIERACDVRQLRLITPRSGPIDLRDVIRYHVQGIARSDLDGRAVLAFSVSGREHGALWFARFELASGRLAPEARVDTVVRTQLPHPGGMQASGQLLAVACEGDKGYARVEIYDFEDLREPRDTLVLNNSLKEGVSQLTRSAAGWLTFAEASPGEYLLFVGGRSFAQREGWFYRYRPHAATRWEFLGPFTGMADGAWGPQSGAAMVRANAESALEMVTFGGKGPNGKDAYRTRVRCFGIDTALPYKLLHQPPVLSFPGAKLKADLKERFEPNVRWGSTAFMDGDALLTYFTARNPRPDANEDHVLRIAEVRCRA
ncbi:MAG TPA: hypothetical protein VFX59_27765 [Polyangiales bacterium]|nr:hypothetical protein [Polyangiales bacterium]